MQCILSHNSLVYYPLETEKYFPNNSHLGLYLVWKITQIYKDVCSRMYTAKKNKNRNVEGEKLRHRVLGNMSENFYMLQRGAV